MNTKKLPRRNDINHAAKIYATLEVEDIFAVAVALYMALEDANTAIGRVTEPMVELAPAITDWPADLPRVLAQARTSWNGGAA